jgi:hypothetical protein
MRLRNNATGGGMPIRRKPDVERRSEPRTTILQTGLIDEIVEVLMEFGGSAHRDSVILRVASRRGLAEVPDRLRRDLMNAFDLDCAGAGELESRVCLPFGEGSRRWAMTPVALDVGSIRLRVGMAADVPVEPIPIHLVASGR